MCDPPSKFVSSMEQSMREESVMVMSTGTRGRREDDERDNGEVFRCEDKNDDDGEGEDETDDDGKE